ncbi:MAG: GNAT family N-acetyltransferase [Candidatus Dojkabacteria bacterium]|nr:GNAT family N-acetyltransferase [Candidatus Dojkabacteria bacterium]
MNEEKKLTLQDFEQNSKQYTREVQTQSGENITFRPLLHSDLDRLTSFLENLSTDTRRLSTFDSYDKVTATELCNAINKYDKLRFVLESQSKEIVGLIEFTLDIPQNVIDKYITYGLKLNTEYTCRFGPTLADKYQDQGLGSLIFPYVVKIAKLLGRKHIILYGGVFADNTRAIKYYEKHRFRIAGKYNNDDGVENLDMILDI